MRVGLCNYRALKTEFPELERRNEVRVSGQKERKGSKVALVMMKSVSLHLN